MRTNGIRWASAVPVAMMLATVFGACDEEGEPSRRSVRREVTASKGETKEVSVPTEPTSSASERTLSGPMKGIYRYTDDKGVIHFVDSIKKVPKRYRKKARHPTGGAVTIIPSTPVDDLIEKHGLDADTYRSGDGKKKKHGRVIIYTTPWCGACKAARAFLKSRGVEFTEKNVESSVGNLKEMLRKSGGARGVPVIDIRGTVIRGFSRQSIDRALGR